MIELPEESRRFACSSSPRRRAGRRRLALGLVALTLAALAGAVVAWTGDRRAAAVLASLVAVVPLFAWRMSGDLDPVELWVAGGQLTIRTRRHLLRFPLAGATGRRLSDKEKVHLARLSQKTGFLTSAGGFDSHLLGEFELYASNLENAILVETGDDRLVVTPDDPARFLHHLAER